MEYNYFQQSQDKLKKAILQCNSQQASTIIMDLFSHYGYSEKLEEILNISITSPLIMNLAEIKEVIHGIVGSNNYYTDIKNSSFKEQYTRNIETFFNKIQIFKINSDGAGVNVKKNNYKANQGGADNTLNNTLERCYVLLMYKVSEEMLKQVDLFYHNTLKRYYKIATDIKRVKESPLQSQEQKLEKTKQLENSFKDKEESLLIDGLNLNKALRAFFNWVYQKVKLHIKDLPVMVASTFLAVDQISNQEKIEYLKNLNFDFKQNDFWNNSPWTNKHPELVEMIVKDFTRQEIEQCIEDINSYGEGDISNQNTMKELKKILIKKEVGDLSDYLTAHQSVIDTKKSLRLSSIKKL